MTAFPAALATVATLGGTANGIGTTLSSGIDNAVVTIPVVDTTGFPTAGYIVIDTEVIQYTGKTSNSFTGATRASDGSAAASHSSAAAVSCYIVAAHVSNLQNEVIAIETLLGITAGDIDLRARLGFGILVASPSGNHTGRIFLDDDGTLALNLLT